MTISKERLEKLDRFIECEKKRFVALNIKVRNLLESKIISDQEGRMIAKIMAEVNSIARFDIWAFMQKKIENLFVIHPYIEKMMVGVTSDTPIDFVNFTNPNEITEWDTSVPHQELKFWLHWLGAVTGITKESYITPDDSEEAQYLSENLKSYILEQVELAEAINLEGTTQ